MTLNMFLLGALQVGSIYAPDFKTFLAVRALFGIAMGGKLKLMTVRKRVLGLDCL